ncbi:MAG: tRNA1(Val) (adenine(37)-N6)-methyltransferase [Clostridia bacterium]
MDTERIDNLGINDLKIIQDSNFFCFGTDSVLLANFVNSSSFKNIIVDLCTGTGIIPVILSAKCKYRKIFAVELQTEMFNLLDANIKLNKLNNCIVSINDDIKNVDKIREIIAENVQHQTVDIVVCNPPYKKIGSGSINENQVKYIARHEVKCTLDDIFKTSSNLLRSHGKLYLVHKPERLCDIICIGRKYKMELKRLQFVYPTINKDPSIILMECVKDGGNELKVLKPLIEYDSNGKYSKQMNEIYSKKGDDTK